MNLNKLFSPQSIAVIGASKNPDKIGHQLLKKLLGSNIAHIFPINPKHKQILNQPCYANVLQVPHSIDQAVIAVPAQLVSQVVQGCVNKNISSLIIISAGFSETGPAGAKLESKIKKICQSAKLSLLGPNCLGYAVPKQNLDLTFAKTAPQPGNIAIVSQSGAIGSFLFAWAKQESLGFSKFVSLGNRAGINENHCLEYLSQDKDTKVIGLYLESFANGEKFLKTASRASRKKPIIVLFGGQTKTGHQAAQSHTAALSPETNVISTALNQAGCIQAKNLDSFTQLLEIFSREPTLTDNDLVIITNAGGPAILAADQADEAKFELTGFNLQTAESLKKSLPSQIQINNPFDLLGDAAADRFDQALKAITRDKSKDAFLIILTPQTMTQPAATAKVIVKNFKSVKKPLIVSIMGGKTADPAKKILEQNNIATIDFPQKAIALLQTLYQYWHNRSCLLTYPARQTKTKKVSQKKILYLKHNLKPGLINWQQIKSIASTYSLPLVDTSLVTSKNLDNVINSYGWPLVLKSDPSETIHRTEKKGLYLNLNSKTAVKKAYRKLSQQFKTILAQPQLKQGVELFIGFKREPKFPPMITVGSGGIYTEIYHDVAHAFLPLNKKIALQLIKQTKIGQIILGTRGLPPLAVSQVINLLLNLSQSILDLPQIQEMDINPVIVSENKISIVDIKVKI